MVNRNLMVESTHQIILSWGSKTINSPWEFSNILLKALSLDVFLQLPWDQTAVCNSSNSLFILQILLCKELLVPHWYQWMSLKFQGHLKDYFLSDASSQVLENRDNTEETQATECYGSYLWTSTGFHLSFSLISNIFCCQQDSRRILRLGKSLIDGNLLCVWPPTKQTA